MGAILVSLVIAYRAAPAQDPARRTPPDRRKPTVWAPLQNARLGAGVRHFRRRAHRLHRLRHFPRQSGDLPHRPRQPALPHRLHRSGRDRGAARAGGAGRRRGLLAMVGLRRNVLAQIVVILQGVARLVALVIAIAAVLEPWGVQSQDMFGALRAAYFGFSVGGVTLSLSSMIAAAAVFAVALFVTRLVQDWLGARLSAPDPSRRRGQQLGQHDFRLRRRRSSPCCWRARKSGSTSRSSRSSPAACRSASASACRRSPTISSPASSSCGSAASASATGSWWETNRDSCTASTPARPRSRPSIAAL